MGWGMDALLKKNESQTNEILSKMFIVIFAFITVSTLACVTGLFTIDTKIMVIFLVCSIIPLFLPVLLIYVMHINKSWIKYMALSILCILMGAAYCVFTFQMIILFVVPVIVAAIYMDRKLLVYVGILSCILIVVSHVITAFWVLQPWLEVFGGLVDILRYGALPRCMQFLLCYFLVSFINKFQIDYMEKMTTLVNENKEEAVDSIKQEYDKLMEMLTEREREVFNLLTGGATNKVISETLFLSMGTVKNYVSQIYDKIEIKDRNYIILKYSRFYVGDD